MAEKYADKPLVLLGINSDESRSALQKTMEEQKITWPQIWDGKPGVGKIARNWNVSGWPTIYVIDHEGVIRGKNVRGEPLTKLVEELLEKVPARR